MVMYTVTTGQVGHQFHRITGAQGPTPQRRLPRPAGEVKGRRRRRAQRACPRRSRGPCDVGLCGWVPRRRWQSGPGAGATDSFGTLGRRWRHVHVVALRERLEGSLEHSWMQDDSGDCPGTQPGGQPCRPLATLFAKLVVTVI